MEQNAVQKKDDSRAVGIIIQARMNSSRYPGKVLHRVAGKPMLQYIIESLRCCNFTDQIIIATSREDTDNPVSEFCESNGVLCFRGPLANVSARFLIVLESIPLAAFIRISGDSPLMDHRLVNKAYRLFMDSDVDVLTNTRPRTYPKGQSVEIIRSSTFINTFPHFSNPGELEHVTPYFYNHSSKFKISNFESGEDFGSIQLSVDTVRDMQMFETIVSRLEKPLPEYTFKEIIAISRSIKPSNNGNA